MAVYLFIVLIISSPLLLVLPGQARHTTAKRCKQKKGKRGEKNILNKAIKDIEIDRDISPLIIYGLKLKLKF